MKDRDVDDANDGLGSCRCNPYVRALRRLAEIARRHYGKHADLTDALDRLDAAR